MLVKPWCTGTVVSSPEYFDWSLYCTSFRSANSLNRSPALGSRIADIRRCFSTSLTLDLFTKLPDTAMESSRFSTLWGHPAGTKRRFPGVRSTLNFEIQFAFNELGNWDLYFVSKNSPIMRQGTRFRRCNFEDRVHSVGKHWTQIRNLQKKALGEVLLRQHRLYLSSTYLFTRKESPPLPAWYHVHPKVGAKSINMKVAICACASHKKTRPALMVEGTLRSLFEVVVL